MINSVSNKQVKWVVNLRNRSRARREEGLYLAEGLRMCRELSPEEVKVLYVTEAFARDRENERWAEQFHVESVSDIVMNVMADTKTPQGVLAVVRQKRYTLEDVLGGNSLNGPKNREPKPGAVMILETIQDPGNLGTILRAGEGAGITGLVMNRETADIYSPKVIRSTMGSILRVPFLYAEDLHDACVRMKAEGFTLYAAHLKGTNNYDQEDYTDNVGFLIGNEANGLTEAAAALADRFVKIPMLGKVESLNAAVAASVLMFEMARQRRTQFSPADGSGK